MNSRDDICGPKGPERLSLKTSNAELHVRISDNNIIPYDMIYLLTEIWLTPGGISTVHIYTQTIRRTTQLTTLVGRLSGIRNQSGQNK
jgi:uncharacterized integral membrane protein